MRQYLRGVIGVKTSSWVKDNKNSTTGLLHDKVDRCQIWLLQRHLHKLKLKSHDVKCIGAVLWTTWPGKVKTATTTQQLYVTTNRVWHARATLLLALLRR